MADNYTIKKKKVYFEGKEIPEADAKSIKVLSPIYMRDATQVFCEDSLIEDADPETFEVIDDTTALSRDAKHVFAACFTVKGADPASLVHLGGSYISDNKAIYCSFGKLKCDYDSFEMIGQHFAKDKDHIYWSTKKVKDADMQSFHLLDEVNEGIPDDDHHSEWAADKNSIYNANGLTRLKTDGATLQVLNHLYAKDKDRVFCFAGWLDGREHVLRGADPESFAVVEGGIACDDKAYYLDGERVTRKKLKQEGCSSEKDIKKYLNGLRMY